MNASGNNNGWKNGKRNSEKIRMSFLEENVQQNCNFNHPSPYTFVNPTTNTNTVAANINVKSTTLICPYSFANYIDNNFPNNNEAQPNSTVNVHGYSNPADVYEQLFCPPRMIAPQNYGNQ